MTHHGLTLNSFNNTQQHATTYSNVQQRIRQASATLESPLPGLRRCEGARSASKSAPVREAHRVSGRFASQPTLPPQSCHVLPHLATSSHRARTGCEGSGRVSERLRRPRAMIWLFFFSLACRVPPPLLTGLIPLALPSGFIHMGRWPLAAKAEGLCFHASCMVEAQKPGKVKLATRISTEETVAVKPRVRMLLI